MNDDYSDIIDLPHHVSDRHPHMTMHDRAAQFAPFAALSGHSAAIAETARLTDVKPELDEDRKAELDRELAFVMALDRSCTIEIEYFIADERKSGGRIETICGGISRIDNYRRLVVMQDGIEIPVDDIVSLDVADTDNK